MNLIDEWKEQESFDKNDEALENILKYISSEIEDSLKENEILLSKVFPLVVRLYNEDVKHFDFGLIIYCITHGKTDALSMYKKLIK